MSRSAPKPLARQRTCIELSVVFRPPPCSMQAASTHHTDTEHTACMGLLAVMLHDCTATPKIRWICVGSGSASSRWRSWMTSRQCSLLYVRHEPPIACGNAQGWLDMNNIKFYEGTIAMTWGKILNNIRQMVRPRHFTPQPYTLNARPLTSLPDGT